MCLRPQLTLFWDRKDKLGIKVLIIFTKVFARSCKLLIRTDFARLTSFGLNCQPLGFRGWCLQHLYKWIVVLYQYIWKEQLIMPKIV